MDHMNTTKAMSLVIPIFAFTTVCYGAGGYFTKETCDGSRAFAKRVFLTKQMGMSYSKYREVEGTPEPGPAGTMVTKIEKGIFANSGITSESLASEYAYSVCMTWPK